MIEPENSKASERIFAEATRHIKSETLRSIQMAEDGTAWGEIAEVIGAANARAAEQRVRRARQWMERKFKLLKSLSFPPKHRFAYSLPKGSGNSGRSFADMCIIYVSLETTVPSLCRIS